MDVVKNNFLCFLLSNQLSSYKIRLNYLIRVEKERTSNSSTPSWTSRSVISARISEKVPIRSTFPRRWSILLKKCERTVNIQIEFRRSRLALDPNAHVSKRTHQLKYLVELAKANETRLNQLWSNAKSSSRTTAMKYGW